MGVEIDLVKKNTLGITYCVLKEAEILFGQVFMKRDAR